MRNLLAHVFSTMVSYATLAETGHSPGRPSPNLVQFEPDLSAFRSLADRGRGAWAKPGVLDDPCDYRFLGTVAGSRALGIHVTDLLVHGWDLSRATSQDDAMDETCTQFALRTFELELAGDKRGGYFAEPIATPEGGDTQTALLSFSGRQPGWTASSWLC